MNNRLGFSIPSMQTNFRGVKKTPQKVYLTTIHKAFITRHICNYSEVEQLMRLNLIPAVYRTTEKTVDINFLLDFINKCLLLVFLFFLYHFTSLSRS